ncbi:MAG: hypothetical protein J5726_04205 [Treponema sp.]|nr:hypothetical protein [Treponema sp.]
MNGEMDELDEKEQERRKQDQIEYRKKKSASNTFLFFGTIFEIIITLAIVIGIVLLEAIIILKWMNLPDQVKGNVFQFASVGGLIGGIILGFMAYKAIGRVVIKKFHLEDKLRDDVLNQFKTRKEYKEYYEKKQQR